MKFITTIIRAQIFLLGFGLVILNADEAIDGQETQKTKGLIRKSFYDKNHTKMGLLRKPLFPGANEVELLRSLLDASPERLKIMKKTIERVESMSPEKKKEIKMRWRQLKESPPHLRAQELGRLKRRHDQLSEYWATLNSKDRQNEIKAFRALSFTEREKYFKSVIKFKKGQ